MVQTLHSIEALPDTARIWIYQADRRLTDSEAEFVREHTGKFLESWNAHGNPLRSGFAFEHNRFLVLAVDESFNMASGCSIDTSVNLIRFLNDQLNVDFLDRKQVAFWQNEEVVLYPISSLKEAITLGHIQPDTLVFNNLMQQLGSWRKAWRVPAAESWLRRYFG